MHEKNDERRCMHEEYRGKVQSVHNNYNRGIMEAF
jgi:hypothetical protein